MKNPTKAFVYLFLFVLFISCEQDFSYPHKYVFYSSVPGDLVGFTNNYQPLSDKGIQSFVNGNKDGYWVQTTTSRQDSILIEVYSEDSASFNGRSYQITRKDGILYFESYRKSMTSHADVVKDERFYFSPLTIENHGYGMEIFYRYCYYFYEERGRLVMPMITFKHNRWENQFFSSSGVINANNIFNTSWLENLNTTSFIDTVVYQENQVVFRRVD